MKYERLYKKLGLEKIKSILKNAHDDAIYYVDEWHSHFKVHGFYADKFIVGVHNASTHYKLKELEKLI